MDKKERVALLTIAVKLDELAKEIRELAGEPVCTIEIPHIAPNAAGEWNWQYIVEVFLNDLTVKDKYARLTSTQLYDRYIEWSKAYEYAAMSQSMFGKCMGRIDGIKRIKSNGIQTYCGVRFTR
jgi:hypothetical protein